MKKGLEILLIIISILAVSFVSAIAVEDSLHLNIQVTNSSNNNSILTGTFNFVFNISSSADCSNVLYTNSSTLTTDSRGVISYYLGNVNLDYSEQYWLCYYRNNVLINASKIARVPYAFRAKNVTLSGVEIDSSLNLGNFNLTASIGNFGVGIPSYSLNVMGNVNITGNITTIGKINGVTLPPPTCSGTEKLTFNGVSFSCSVDILGSGGSGIIASANNASRSYIQFADGTMIETINYNGVISSTVQTAITIPQPFIDGNYTVQAIGDYQTWATADNAFTNGGQNNGSYVHLRSFTANSANAHYRITIIGRWTTLTNITQNTTSWAVNGNGDTVLFDTTKNVGIGTTSPGAKLDVAGTTASYPGRTMITDDGNYAAIIKSYKWSGTALNYLASEIFTTGDAVTPYGGLLKLGVSNAAANIGSETFIYPFVINSAGNVGIGTISPTQTLEVNGTIWATQGHIIVATSGGGSGVINWGNSTTGNLYFRKDSVIGNPTSYTDLMVILNNGNVGIGTTTPERALNVRGSGNFSGTIYINNKTSLLPPTCAGTEKLTFDGTTFSCQADAGLTGNYFNQQLNTTSSPTFANLTLADIYAAGGRNLIIGDDTYLTDIDVASTLGIYSFSDPTVGSIKLGSGGGIISGYNNNVGIGTTTPSQKLDVAGNITASTGRVYDKTGFVQPVGSITAYGGSTAPTGWFLCNGEAVSRTTYADLFAVIGTTYGVGDGSTTFTLPDLRGVFARGAGTSGKLSMANGTAFSATLGTYQNDSFQGHYHYLKHSSYSEMATVGQLGGAASTSWYLTNPSVTSAANGALGVTRPLTDGTSGTPRTGAETTPASVVVNYIIKY